MAAIPCSSFSLARRGSPGSPGGPLRLVGKRILGHPKALARPMDRQKILTGNALASSTAKILHTAHISSCPWGVDNGANSRLWHHPEFEALARLPCTNVRTTCMCQHGATHKKKLKCCWATLIRIQLATCCLSNVQADEAGAVMDSSM